MRKEIIASGKDIQLAIANAKEALGVDPLSDIGYEIIDLGSKGIFGVIGAKPVKIKAYIEIPEKEERRKRNDRKKERRERNDNAPQVTKEASEGAAENAEKSTEETPKTNTNKNKKHKKKPQSNQRAEESKPKTQVIPECELKFERRDVAEGEDMSYDFIRTVILDIGLNATAELYSCDDGTRRITSRARMLLPLSVTTATLLTLSSTSQTLLLQRRTFTAREISPELPLTLRGTERRERKLSAHLLAEWLRRRSRTEEALCSSP